MVSDNHHKPSPNHAKKFRIETPPKPQIRRSASTQPTACPELVEGAQAVGKTRNVTTSPEGAKSGSDATTNPTSVFPHRQIPKYAH